jgi:hypothetical protein
MAVHCLDTVSVMMAKVGYFSKVGGSEGKTGAA